MSESAPMLVPELSVADLDRSLDFYVRILGFRIDFRRVEAGFASIRLGAARIMLDEIDRTRTWRTGELQHPLGRGLNLFIEVVDVNVLLAQLAREDISLFQDIEDAWYRVDDREEGSRQFLVQDPDGYLLRFSQYLGERPLLRV